MPFDGYQDIDLATALLIRAREKIERGWCQGICEDEQGNVCMVGALGWSDDPNTKRQTDSEWSIYKSSLDRLMRVKLVDSRSVTEWNDHPDRTKEQVLAVFDAAIASGINKR